MSKYAVMPIADYVGACDSIREKTGNTEVIKSGEIPDQINEVYAAGQSSMVDESKIIEKTVSGIGSVTVDDVSEIPHEILVKVEKNKNLFDKNNPNVLNAWFTNTTISAITSLTKSVYIPCLPNTTYTASKTASARFYMGFTTTLPKTSVRVENAVGGENQTVATSTSPADAEYLVVWCYHQNYDTNITFEEIIDTLQIEVGATASPYVPHADVEDLSEVTISRLNSNLFGGSAMADKMQELAPTITREGNTVTYKADDFHKKDLISGCFKENTRYTIVLKGTNAAATTYLNLNLHYTDGTTKEILETTGAFVTAVNKTVQSITGTWKAGTVTMNCDECGIFEGHLYKRDFEPYIEPKQYKANADGTVEGVTSLSPNMTLQSNVGGVNIEMTYRKSYGMQTEWDRFWDGFQHNGTRTDYRMAFRFWYEKAFKPKYDIIVEGNASMMFAYSKIGDLAQILEDCGVKLDTSGATNLSEAFSYGGTFTHLPEISTLGCGGTATHFYGLSTLVTIDKWILKEDGSQTHATSTFQNDTRLANIVVEGTIGTTLTMQWCPLTKASILSVFNALSDTAEGMTLTLNLSAVNTAFETSSGTADGSTSEEWLNLVATKPNWTISLV